MTIYKLDYNRGSDSNDGISAPWQNLSKLTTIAAASGDSILLARDSIWALTANVNVASSGSMAGTPGAPVYIGCYDTALETSAKPQINLRITLPSNAQTPGTWTYDGANNGWYYTGGYDYGPMSRVELGGALAYKQISALPMVSSPYWRNDASNKFYVYAPSGSDPVAYYGSVVVGPEARSGLYFSDKGTDVVIEDISAVNAAAPVGIWCGNGGHSYRLNRIDMDGCAALNAISPKSGTGANQLIIDGLMGVRLPAGAVHLVETASGTNYWTTNIIRNCRITDGNLAGPWGAIYTQAHNTIIEDNYLARIRWGSPAYSSGGVADGSGIYADISASNVRVQRNTIEDCGTAMQHGSCDVATFTNNLIVNCSCAQVVDNAAAIAQVTHNFWHNTIINAGVPHQAYGGIHTPRAAWWAYRTNIKADVRNNIFIGTNQSGEVAFAQPSGGFYAGSTIYSNVVYRFAAMTGISYNEGTAGPLTPTNTVTSDPLLSSTYVPSQTGPAYYAGVHLGYSLDRDGHQRNNPPTIGAYEPTFNRGTASSRGTR